VPELDLTLPPARDTLVEALVAGEEGAFEQFAADFAQPVLSLAYRLTGDLESAHDIRQLALWRVYRSIARFEKRSQLSTWLYRIVVNLCRDWARSRAAHPTGSHPSGPGRAPATARDANLLERDERHRLIRRALLTLDDAEREIIALRHMQGMTFREMASILDRPETTVKSQCARALDRLHDALADKGLVPMEDD